jgi:hypothetical protein
MMDGQVEGEGRERCDEGQWALLIPPTVEGAEPNCFDAAAISAMSCHGCRESCRREVNRLLFDFRNTVASSYKEVDRFSSFAE